MKRYQRLVAVLLSAALVLSGCGSSTSTTTTTESATEESSSGAYTAGTYTGTSENGKNGSVVVSVTFTEDAIASIEVTNQQETESIAEPALEKIPEEIVANQSLAVDAVSGATITSEAIIEAVADAVEQAGGDVEALYNVAVEKVLSTEEVELQATVVIAGLGAAGMAAAMAAADAGVDVIVVEKQSSIGGNAIVSGGYVDTLQFEDLHVDNNEIYTNAIEEFLAAGPENDSEAAVWDELLQEYEDYLASGDTKVFDSMTLWAIQFARTDGYEYEGNTYVEFIDEFVEWFTEKTGAEWNSFAGIVGYAWPRWTSLQGYYSGMGYFDLFEMWMEDSGADITIMTSTAAKELIQDEDGRVTGLVAEGEDGTTYYIYGTNGVILCTGGYAYNIEMVIETDEIWGDLLSTDMLTTNAAGATGDGILMAEEIGAGTAGMENTMLFPLADVKNGSTEAIVGMSASLLMVNQEGVRFVDETTDRYTISGAVLEQTNQIVYAISCEANSLIEDGKTTGGTDIEQMIANGELYRADTIEELAELIGMDAEVLQATIDSYNEMCTTGVDEEFGRTTFEDGSEIGDGPYYAYPCAVATHITMGGLLADENGQVYTADYEPIEGLFAAGEITCGNCGIDGSFAYGRVAGAYVAGLSE